MLIYKYHSFESYTLDSLANNQIYFSKRTQFNDPFDCKPPIKISGFNRFKEIFRRAADRIPNCADSFKNFIKSEDALNLFYQPLSDHKKFRDDLNEFSDNVGVFSSTRLRDHPLMWGHYANGHRGFCVGYQVDFDNEHQWYESSEFCENSVVMKNIDYSKFTRDMAQNYILLFSLFYEDPAFRDLDGFLSHKAAQRILDESRFMERFFDHCYLYNMIQKHPAWSYEEEIRILLIPGEGIELGLKHRKCKIDNITFGVEMPESQRKTLTRLIHGTDVKYFRAVYSKTELAVDLVPC